MKRSNKRNVLVTFAATALVFCGFGAATSRLKASANGSLADLNASVTMIDGAQIRLTSGSTGLRYAAKVSAESVPRLAFIYVFAFIRILNHYDKTAIRLYSHFHFGTAFRFPTSCQPLGFGQVKSLTHFVH